MAWQERRRQDGTPYEATQNEALGKVLGHLEGPAYRAVITALTGDESLGVAGRRLGFAADRQSAPDWWVRSDGNIDVMVENKPADAPPHYIPVRTALDEVGFRTEDPNAEEVERYWRALVDDTDRCPNGADWHEPCYCDPRVPHTANQRYVAMPQIAFYLYGQWNKKLGCGEVATKHTRLIVLTSQGSISEMYGQVVPRCEARSERAFLDELVKRLDQLPMVEFTQTAWLNKLITLIFERMPHYEVRHLSDAVLERVSSSAKQRRWDPFDPRRPSPHIAGEYPPHLM